MEINPPEQFDTTPSNTEFTQNAVVGQGNTPPPSDGNNETKGKLSIFGKTKGRKIFNACLLSVAVLAIIWIYGGYDHFKKNYEFYSNKDFKILIVDDNMSDQAISDQGNIALKFDKNAISQTYPGSPIFVIGKSKKDGLMQLYSQNAYTYEVSIYLQQNDLGTIYSGDFTRKLINVINPVVPLSSTPVGSSI